LKDSHRWLSISAQSIPLTTAGASSFGIAPTLSFIFLSQKLSFPSTPFPSITTLAASFNLVE
jgi:hypothetical protein